MFRRLINDAKSAVSSVVLKYVARASVAVPFLIAAGFAIAAITLTLVERYGAVTAYLMMAGGLALIGVVAATVVTVKEHEEEVAEEKAEEAAAPAVSGEMALQVPMAVLGALLSSPVGPSTSLGLLRVIGRNLPLVALLVMIGALFWPTEATADTEPDAKDEREQERYMPGKPNGHADHAVH